MKRSNLKILMLISFLLLIGKMNLISQENADTVVTKKYAVLVSPKLEKDKVVLRWVPVDYNWFVFANQYGYTIERAVFDHDPVADVDLIPDNAFDTKPLPGMPMKPWTMEEFRANIKSKDDIYLGVAMEMLYGDVDVTGNLQKGSNMQDAVMEQGNRFAFAMTAADLNREAALSLALRYEDKDVVKGKYYQYRIYINYEDSEFKSDTAEFYIKFEGKDVPKQKVENCFVEEHDKSILVSWNYSNRAHFSAYDVERSMDKKEWQVLNKRPYISSAPEGVEMHNYVYIDDSLTNFQTYHYRIRGYTPFSEMGLYSDILTAAPKDLTPPSPVFKINAEDKGGFVMISWEAAPNEADFDGFYVGRSTSAVGPFDKISPKLPKTERTFLDLQPMHLDDNYYVVISADTYGNESQSFSALGFIIDNTPPVKPTWVSGSMDSTGMVRLEWNRGPEADIIGYRVYWANDTISEFSQLKGEIHSHTVFLDSVNVKTLNKFSYYKIAAVDHRYNHSEYSEILVVKKPDVVPPAAAVFNDYKVIEENVTFSWYVSSSDDVAKQVVEKSEDGITWKPALTINNNTVNTYEDKDIKSNHNYHYRILVIDDAGNKTISKPLEISANSKGWIKGDLELITTIEDGKAVISWVTNLKPVKFVLSKSNEDMISKLAVVSDLPYRFVDANYTKGDSYFIKAIMANGDETPTVGAVIKGE